MNELMRKLLFLPPQVSSMAREIDALHYFVIIVTMIGAGLVTLVGGYYLLKYRRGVRGEPAFGDAGGPGVRDIPLSAELAVVFGLLGMFVLWWYIGYDQYARIRTAPEKTLNVYVTAKKWMWNFAYTTGAGSSGTLYVPVDTPVKLIMTSRDVIHSFFVPEFRVKMDVLPGRFTTLWFQAEQPGTYPILCTEYCGMGHSSMRGQVVVAPQGDFRLEDPEGHGPGALPVVASAEQQRRALTQGPPLSQIGERVSVEFGCLRCHTIDGTPHIGPTWAGLYGTRVRLVDGRRAVVDEAYLTESMMEPLAKLRGGFQPVMPTYFGVLPAPETAAIVEYIKSLRGVRAAASRQAFTPSGAGAVPVPVVPDLPVQPLVPAPDPRADEAPYAPPGTGETSP